MCAELTKLCDYVRSSETFITVVDMIQIACVGCCQLDTCPSVGTDEFEMQATYGATKCRD